MRSRSTYFFVVWRCEFLVEVWILVEDFHTFFRVRMANILPYEIGHSLGVLLTYRGENTQPNIIGNRKTFISRVAWITRDWYNNTLDTKCEIFAKILTK